MGRLQVGPEAEIVKPRLDAEMRIWGAWWGGCHLPDTVVGWGLCWALDAWVSVPPPSLSLTSLVFWDTHCVSAPRAEEAPWGVTGRMSVAGGFQPD